MYWLVGGFFLLAGVFGSLFADQIARRGDSVWVVRGFFGVFGLLGALALIAPIRSLLRPVVVRHAAADVLAGVPREPVLLEGSTVYGRLTHELARNDVGWLFRPRPQVRRSDTLWLVGFGVPFLVVFAGIMAWVFHRDRVAGGWGAAVAGGIAITLVSGGVAYFLIGMLMRAGYRRLCHLNIPQNGDLKLDAPRLPEGAGADLAAGLNWILLGGTERQQLTIPREVIAAVQLCPWEFVAGRHGATNVLAAQGLLVVANPAEPGVYHRLPILLTGDLSGAARLMQQLAEVLQVPYLFHADEQGWNAEHLRAKDRPPLTIGGVQS
jgi:hypothetical protein